MRSFITMFLVVAVLSLSLLAANPLMGKENAATETQKTPDPIMVALVGLLIGGGGWLMLGDMDHFIKDLVITFLLSFVFGIGIFYAWYSAYKAYQEAVKRQEALGEKAAE